MAVNEHGHTGQYSGNSRHSYNHAHTKVTKENYKDSFSDLRADAGIGFTYTFHNFGPLETVTPLVLRFDMPLFLNRAPATDDDFVQMRWLIGINRAF